MHSRPSFLRKIKVAVLSFAGHTHLLLPFSTDRQDLETALGRVDLMRSLDEEGSNIYSAVYLDGAQTLQRATRAPRTQSDHFAHGWPG